MKAPILAALAACLAVPAAAQHDITVHSAPTFEEWVARTSGHLNNSLKLSSTRGVPSGVTFVQFECSDTGDAINVKTVERGNRHLDRLGRSVVNRMKSMHPLFNGVKDGQIYEAAIMVADTQNELDGYMADVEKRMERQNAYWAARKVPNPVISLAAIAL